MKTGTFASQKFQQLSANLASRLYSPSATGSHEIGHPVMGPVALSSVEFTNWPEAARTPMLRIAIKVPSIH
jgi:hypothetical protein